MINNLEIFTFYLLIATGFFVILFVVLVILSIFYDEYKSNQEVKNYIKNYRLKITHKTIKT